MSVILNADRNWGEEDTSRGRSLGSRWSILRSGIDALERTLVLKKITLANYRQDRHYARIVKATEDLLREKGFVAPVDLFIRMDLLSPESVEDWRRGRISYLERLILCNLSKASRILRILQMHAHDLDLKPVPTVYKRWTKGPRTLLWFSKTGDRHVEDAYARHFFSPSKETHLGGGDRRSVARASHAFCLRRMADSCRGQQQAQAVSVRPRKSSRAVCSRCRQTAPDYDQLAERRFECNYRASHIA